MVNQFLLSPVKQDQDIEVLDVETEERTSRPPAERDPLTLYLKKISTYPLLIMEEERQIGKALESIRAKITKLEKKKKDITKDPKYRLEYMQLDQNLNYYKNKMINSNLRLVVSVAKKYQHRGLSLLDLIDEGNIGLIEAVERFDYRRGCRFSTYGTWWIKQAIVKSLSDKGRVIRIPIHMLNTIKKCYHVAKHLTQELGRDPTCEELAEYMNLPPSKIKDIINLSQETASLDATVDDKNMTKLSDMISDKVTQQPIEMVFNLTLQNTIQKVLNKLSEREMKILQLRYGLAGEGPYTLEETGKVFGITRERVRQIQENALTKLRHYKIIKELKEFI